MKNFKELPILILFYNYIIKYSTLMINLKLFFKLSVPFNETLNKSSKFKFSKFRRIF